MTAPPRPKKGASRSARHLTIADICDDLGITRSTFYDWRAKRKGPPSRKLPNGEIRIERRDYETWLDSLYEEVA
jgi:predicted DNA-binding transcriptional regulator AlpA